MIDMMKGMDIDMTSMYIYNMQVFDEPLTLSTYLDKL